MNETIIAFFKQKYGDDIKIPVVANINRRDIKQVSPSCHFYVFCNCEKIGLTDILCNDLNSRPLTHTPVVKQNPVSLQKYDGTGQPRLICGLCEKCKTLYWGYW